MGPYCKFCNQRCFVPRILKDGRSLILATCVHGMEHDREVTGEDATTAVNPVALAVVTRINARYDAGLTLDDLRWFNGNLTIDGMDPSEWVDAVYGDGEES